MENNVICGCFNITLKDMKNGISDGINSFEEFQEKTGIGTGCPPCLENNKLLFKKILDQYSLSLIDEILVL